MATKRRNPSASAPSKTTESTRKYTRPGVEASVRLRSLSPISDHVDGWDRALSRYAAMIRAKGGTRLADLDARREGLPLARRCDRTWPRIADEAEAAPAAAAGATSLTKEQLLDVIVEWKFLKGKPRNALWPLLRSNADASVAAASRRAFAAADGIPKTMSVDASSDGDDASRYATEIAAAVSRLCEIRGVGPATASAVLCLYRPDVFAFMDDEVIECLYDGKRGYTLKIYLEVNDRCREIASQLNMAMEERKGDLEGSSSSSSGGGWTPCKVGKALWTVATMSANDDERGLSTIFDCDAARGPIEKNDSTLNSRKRTKKG
ncbi:hypothetical protein ACHAW5_006655 [Stephanodiscus triporus]|uniref:HhH-GPD domain-containing protein n=1 Tax=Stephanodiscus triporus TaxID=2934178 RepID=A0ABD3NAD5_9STRA